MEACVRLPCKVPRRQPPSLTACHPARGRAWTGRPELSRIRGTRSPTGFCPVWPYAYGATLVARQAASPPGARLPLSITAGPMAVSPWWPCASTWHRRCSVCRAIRSLTHRKTKLGGHENLAVARGPSIGRGVGFPLAAGSVIRRFTDKGDETHLLPPPAAGHAACQSRVSCIHAVLGDSENVSSSSVLRASGLAVLVRFSSLCSVSPVGSAAAAASGGSSVSRLVSSFLRHRRSRCSGCAPARSRFGSPGRCVFHPSGPSPIGPRLALRPAKEVACA